MKNYNANYLKKGSYNVICDQCGRKYKADYTRMQWDGLRTCYKCYDPKHPWLIPLPAVIDSLPVPNSRPRPAAKFVSTTWLSNTIIGVTYCDFREQPLGNCIIDSWTEYLGGSYNLPFTASNFPLE